MGAKQRFLITGGTQGIGEAIVVRARAVGHDVVFTGRNEASIEKIEKATGALGMRADITSSIDNRLTVDFCKARMGGIDVLVNNAGVGYFAELGEGFNIDDMRALFETNVFGLVDLTSRVVPMMKTQCSGDIVNIASTSGMKGHEEGTAYSASKWALRGISQCWQAELRRHNVRVVCVCPSEVQTGFGGGTPGTNPKKLFSDDIAQAVMGALEMNRRGFIPEFAVFATNPW